MGASRQTELEEEFPSHVVCAWMGNSERVARRHYLQVTDEHFAKAVDAARCNFAGRDALQSTANEKSSGENTADNCVVLQSAASAMGGTELESVTSTMSTWRSNQLS